MAECLVRLGPPCNISKLQKYIATTAATRVSYKAGSSSNRDRVCIRFGIRFDGEASRDTRLRPGCSSALPRLILRSKLNLNGVIKDGYQVARGSSLKYCLQIRYQLRSCPFILHHPPYRTLSISLAVGSHSPSANFPDSQPERSGERAALVGYTRGVTDVIDRVREAPTLNWLTR